MKLQAVDFGESDEPETMVVRMTADELAVVYAFVGRISPRSISEAAGLEWGIVFESLAVSLSDVGNRFYDSGWPSLNLFLSVKIEHE